VLTNFNEENCPIPQKSFMSFQKLLSQTWYERILASALSALIAYRLFMFNVSLLLDDAYCSR
jgi:hypothetical protein